MTTTAFLSGLLSGLSLIIAIGAQNTFILRQGLLGQAVFLTCLTCALSDALLIALGCTTTATLLVLSPRLLATLKFLGIAFLILYGLSRLNAARTGTHTPTLTTPPATTGRTLLTTLGLTWLNPHVYLDTCLFLGTLSAPFGPCRLFFGAGAITASCLFFFTLGYGARLLRPLFDSPTAWRMLDLATGLCMGLMATRLALS